MFTFTVNTFSQYESVLIYDADNKLQTRFFFLLWSTLKPRIGYYSCQKAHPIAEAYVKDSSTHLT